MKQLVTVLSRVFEPSYVDIPIRDQRETMERPFFSLAKKPRKTAIEYEVAGTVVKVCPVKEFGIATIWDADILIWAATSPSISFPCLVDGLKLCGIQGLRLFSGAGSTGGWNEWDHCLGGRDHG